MLEISLQPIATVKNERLIPEDDNWNSITSLIELEKNVPEFALNGIEDFSHLEIIFFFDKVELDKAIFELRSPRNNPQWNPVGTLAQRNKNRPNRLGLTTVKLIKREGTKLFVQGLDAISGTPILDIKPVYQEFLPRETVKQSEWSKELMEGYW